MEGEKLEEAKRSFVEDQIKFTKYLSDIDNQADKARDQTEILSKQKFDLNEEYEVLNAELHQYEREIA